MSLPSGVSPWNSIFGPGRRSKYNNWKGSLRVALTYGHQFYLLTYIYIFMMFHIVAANEHTGRGVVGGCWPKASGVKQMRPFCLLARIGTQGGFVWNWTVGKETCDMDHWKKRNTALVIKEKKKKSTTMCEKNEQQRRSLIEHNFLSCLYRWFPINIVSQISSLRISCESYYIFILFCQLNAKGINVFYMLLKLLFCVILFC